MTTYQMIEAIEETNRTWQPLSLPVRNKIAQRLDELGRENVRLRAIFPKILEALGNGSGCAPDVSVEFLEAIPQEVRLLLAKTR
jgi:hypothetical protein